MSLNYSKKTLKHFRQPKNIGEIKNPDAMAEVGNMVCGDQLFFTLKVKDQKIKDIKFLSFGCASNIATASVMTEMVKGKKIEDAKNFDWNKIVAELEGLPKQKVHCSVLAVEGLKKVIAEYEKTNKKVSPVDKKSVKKIIKK
ncbi:MAG: iron-sulfur cluster assembly scaffold protein, partial [Patescibacteria group bacterium]